MFKNIRQTFGSIFDSIFTKMTLFLHFGPADLFDFLSSDNLVEDDSNLDDN